MNLNNSISHQPNMIKEKIDLDQVIKELEGKIGTMNAELLKLHYENEVILPLINQLYQKGV